jgi:hypothetical protein
MPVSLAMKGDRLLFSGLKCALRRSASGADAGSVHRSGRGQKATRFLKKRDLGRKAVLVSDRAGFDAAGARARWRRCARRASRSRRFF